MSPVSLNDSVYLHFGTSSPTTLAAANADSTPVVTVAEDGADMGYSPTVTNIATGLYMVQIDATAANGFETGRRYSVRVAATVGGVTGRDGIGEFEVGTVATAASLATVAGYIDTEIADIQSRLPAALVGGRMDSSIGAVAAGVIAAGSFAANALDAVWSTTTRLLTAGTNIVLAKGVGVTGFNDLSAAQVNAEADTALADVGVTSTVTGRIDAAVSSRLATAGYTAPPAAATIAAAVWDYLTSAATTVGSLGRLIVDNLNATVGSRLASASYTAPLDAAGTRSAVGLASANLDTQLSTIDGVADAILVDTGTTGVIVATNNDKTGYAIGTGGIGASAFAAGAIDAAALNASAVDEILDEQIGDSTVTMRQALKLMAAVLGGKVSGAGTSTITFRNVADTVDVVVATVDGAGNRTAITRTL
jgi:hypothetical protein